MLCIDQMKMFTYILFISVAQVVFSRDIESCLEGRFMCKNKECISRMFICDGTNDCTDGSDEIFCGYKRCDLYEFNCSPASFGPNCISMISVCDGREDCVDGSDELGCELTACKPGEFKCQNGACVVNGSLCDSYPDCEDGSDELNCDTTEILEMNPSTTKMIPSTIKTTQSTTKTTPSTTATSTPSASGTEVIIEDNVTKAETSSNYILDSTSPQPIVLDARESNVKFIQPTLVAFTVGLSNPLDVLLHDVIVYNKVVSNIGDDYENSTGVFRCNIAGLYFFQIHGAAGEGKDLSLSLVKNKTRVISLYSSTNQELSLAANSAVLLLESGDEVFVEASNCGILYGEEHHVINTFSGFLLDKAI